MKKVLLTVILISMACAFSADITWRKYKEIVTDVTISSTDNLIIEAGTTVRFAANAGITVYGQITCNGTEADPIILAPLDRGDLRWEGIYINSASGSCSFNYTYISFADAPAESGKAGLTVDNSNVTVSNCRISNCNGDNGGGMKITGGTVSVLNTLFKNNSSGYGGALYIYNQTPSPSLLNITSCIFENNDGYSSGGAVYILDDPSSGIMEINLSKSLFLENYSGLGGAIYYQNEGNIEAEFFKCRMISNNSDWGSAIYARFQPFVPGTILQQRFSNLLVFKNSGWYQSGIYIDMGNTLNPGFLKFTNNTLAFNSINPLKTENQQTSGLYIKSNGNYPLIENTILWGNTKFVGASNFWIDDNTNPLLINIFKFCDIETMVGGTNISANPAFIRPPLTTITESFNPDRYDLHESLGSPVINAGDPSLTDPDGSRLNIGAYGGTAEAAKGTYSTVVATSNTTVNVSNNAAVILDFQGKSGKFAFNDIVLGQNSQLFFHASANADIFAKSITTPLNLKSEFDGYVSIQTQRNATTGDLTPTQGITLSQNAQIVNANMYNIMLNIDKDVMPSSVNIKNSKFYAETSIISPYAVNITETDNIVIENSSFVDYKGGICVGSAWPTQGKNTKASGRIANNSISFDTDPSNKNDSKAVKRVGVEVSNANIDIENNEIDGGDEGVVMKSNSSGRITNNSVSFDADPVNKKGIYEKKAIVVSTNSTATEITGNTIINNDSSSDKVTGIEINNSKASIFYNTMGFEGSTSGTERTGIKVIAPTDTVKVYNNTIYNTLQAFNVTQGASPKEIVLINNIFWSDQSTYDTINDTTEVKFFNNCFIDPLPSGVTGSGNIYVNPLLNGPSSQDFTLGSSSPCVNAGMVVNGLHVFDAGKAVYYYGTAPDIGAEELYQELSVPSNVSSSVTGSNFNISWNPVSGFYYYKVYSSDTPYGTFSEVYHGPLTNYTAAIGTKKFFYVVATTEAPTKSFDYDITDTNKAENKSVGINTDKKIKNIRIKRNTDR